MQRSHLVILVSESFLTSPGLPWAALFLGCSPGQAVFLNDAPAALRARVWYGSRKAGEDGSGLRCFHISFGVPLIPEKGARRSYFHKTRLRRYLQ